MLSIFAKLSRRLKYIANGELINPKVSKLRGWRKLKRLNNHDFTIVANNCIAGTIYKDLDLTYLTPFVGLYMLPSDFIKLCENLKEYLEKPLLEFFTSSHSYPVAKLGDITLFLMHYPDFESAKKAWDRRKIRVNFENIFYILVQKDGCSEEDMKRFDQLECPNKIILATNNEFNLQSLHVLDSFKNDHEVGAELNYRSRYSGNRYMYDYDFIDWLNTCSAGAIRGK